MSERPMVAGNLDRGFVRVRAQIKLTEPLVPGFWIPRGKKNPTWVSIKYERLQNFCFKCGRLGHDIWGCKEHRNRRDGEDEVLGFGSWLSTPSVRTLEHALVVCRKD